MKRLLALLVFALLPMTSLFAVNVSSLYQIDLPVATQQEEVRSEAIKEGFLQVLIRLSGNADIAKNSVIKANLRRAEYYVQQFSYAAPAPNEATYTIQIRFDKDDVNHLLKKANVQFWAATRPLILMWLAVDENDNATIIGGDETTDWTGIVKNQSKKYGLPIIFPVMDMTDMDQVAAEDISNMRIPLLTQASKRYSPDAILIGKIEKKDDTYEGTWQLTFDNNQWDFNVVGQDRDALFANLLNQVSQTLSKQFVSKQPTVAKTWVKLQVLNVTDRNDLNALMDFLKHLTSVSQVQLSEVTGDQIDLTVLVTGTLEAFLQNAMIGQHLVLQSKDANANKLIYEWKR